MLNIHLPQPCHSATRYIPLSMTMSTELTATDTGQRQKKKLIQRYGKLRKYHTPCAANDHPELDESPLLEPEEHREYQRLIGIGQWMTMIKRYDISYALCSLSRFSAAPREGHFKRLLRVFGYLSAHPHMGLVLDPDDLELDVDFLQWKEDHLIEYPDDSEEQDNSCQVTSQVGQGQDGMPTFDGTELSLTVFADSDHGHDRLTGKSVSGIFVLLGSAPILWKSKRQTPIQTSTYGAEFSALKTAVEISQGLKLMLKSLGVKIKGAVKVLSDSLSVLHSTQPDSGLKQ